MTAFCDIDKTKIGRDYNWVMESSGGDGDAAVPRENNAPQSAESKDCLRKETKRKKKRHVKKIPIIHFSEAQSPIICCVAMGRTNGQFEANVASLNLKEGVDYWHFS